MGSPFSYSECSAGSGLSIRKGGGEGNPRLELETLAEKEGFRRNDAAQHTVSQDEKVTYRLGGMSTVIPIGRTYSHA